MNKWLIKKLGGFTRKEILTVPHSGHTIHLPEYKSKKGIVHLHLCPLRNWKEKEPCEEIKK
jgi:hypothetical protein